MRTFPRGVFFALLLIGVFVTSAEADTVYSYVGDRFTFAQGVYSAGDRITGSFVLSDSFLPTVGLIGVGPQSVTNFVESYSFTDGHQTLTQSNSTGTFKMPFTTDGTLVVPGSAPGAIGSPYWSVSIQTPTSGIQTASLGDYYITAWTGSPQPTSGCGGLPAICYIGPAGSTAVIDGVAPYPFIGLPGTWTVHRVPEGGTTVLFFFAGLVGLTILPRLIAPVRFTIFVLRDRRAHRQVVSLV
jgi:hypothetical protein